MSTDKAASPVACSIESSSLVATVLVEQLRDFQVVQAFRDGVITQLEKTNVNNVIIDLGHVKHIGSIAFLAFLAIRRQSGVDRIVLCNLSDFVQELFRMCKLIATGNGKSAPFEQASTLEEAFRICESSEAKS